MSCDCDLNYHVMETISTNENRRFKWRALSKRIFRSKSLSYAANSSTDVMPACVPTSHNNVADVNANVTHTNANQDSKLHKIMACLFWKKKTDVVDMKKEQKAASKQKMAVDRSERSRRVLKMESLREAPKTRTEDEQEPPSPGTKQMFLPSENPTASFLSYLNPSVRRACSDVIKTNSAATTGNKSQAREAFVNSDVKQVHTRNTSYRAQRVTDREPLIGNSDMKPWELDKPPKLPERTQSQKPAVRAKPIVVPGTMAYSDDDIGYNSDNEISDLQDELCRMNMSQPDLRYHSNERTRGRRREGNNSSSEHNGSLYREGSISVSEASSSDEEHVVVERPQNPSPGQQKRKVFTKIPTDHPRETEEQDNETKTLGALRPKSVENVIDDLFLQTQRNIEHIYRNGLDNMDLETFRSETVTPETCMRRMKADLFEPTVGKREAGILNEIIMSADESKSNVVNENKDINRLTVTDVESTQDSPEMDSLLTEVSIWAKDRQNWLLEDGKAKPDTLRENTEASFATDERVISAVTNSNKERCTEWVDTSGKTEARPTEPEHKPTGILTGAKMFRSSSRNTDSRKVSFSDTESSKASSIRDVKHKHSRKKVTHHENEDKLSRYGALKLESLDSRVLDGPEPWTAEMYTKAVSGGGEDDRSTINDDLSELDHRTRFRARSPDSWLSSNGSCSRLLRPEVLRDDGDSFGTASPFRNTPDMTTVKRTASEPAKSHQIIRKKPVIHTPFANIDRQFNTLPIDTSMNPLSPLKPIVKSSQLKPLSMQLSGNFQQHQFPGLRGNHVLTGSRNMNDFEQQLSVMKNPRPFSEIPVRESFVADRATLADNANDPGITASLTQVRPNSETMPAVKRTDKIGTGNIMATDSMKERNTYAKEIVNSFNKPRHVANTDAFQYAAVNGEPESAKSQKKRHTVFNQKLLNGGYTYEKHSRKHTNDSNGDFMDITKGIYAESERSLPEVQKRNRNTTAHGGVNSTSVSELTVNVRDSHDGNNGMRPFVVSKESMDHIFSNKNTMDTTIGNSYSQSQDETDETNGQPTAVKFKRLRDRRDQEMEWLMKDAAETEV